MIPGSVLLYIGFYFVFFYYYKLINSENYFNNFLSFFIIRFYSSNLDNWGKNKFYLINSITFNYIFLIKSKSKHFIFTILIIFLSIFIIFKDDYLNSRYSSFLSTLNPSLDTKVFNQDEIDDYKKEIDILKNKEKKKLVKIFWFLK